MKEDKSETSFYIEELSWGEYVTVKMVRWHYYIDRGKLMLIEGIYGKEELEKVVEKCNRADTAIKHREQALELDCPRHFELTCRPSDLVRFAREILSLYKGYEHLL